MRNLHAGDEIRAPPAGIHYRFDMVAGLALGRNVADKAMSADLDAVAVR